MRYRKLGMGLLACSLAWAGGCPKTPQGPLAALPPHRLNLASSHRPGRQEPKPAAKRERPGARTPPLTAEERRWYVPPQRQWRHIVVHHSATDRGSADIFDVAHRKRGWDELGYHFVIDNGNGGPNGFVEVGGRWRKQKHGAHCGGTPDNEYNDYGIGICVVGNFCDRLPSRAQLSALTRLTAFLMRTYNVPPENVIGHRDAPDASTRCPGEAFHRYLHGSFQWNLRRYNAAK